MKRSFAYKRVCALLLSLLFVFSPIASSILSLGTYIAQAEAIAKPTADLNGDDNWLYRIGDDGFAEILGYADAAATSLTVPYALGGAWVTRIADNAFAGTPHLSDITIPAAVASIAPTAFSAAADLTIHAPNGTAALAFAAAHGFNASSTSIYDFFEQILDLSELRRSQFSLSGSTIILQEPYASLVAANSLVFFPAVGEYTQGLPARILSVERQGRSVWAAFEMLPFEETLATYAVENVALTPDMNNIIILADGFEVTKPSGGLTSTPKGTISTTLSPSLGFTVNRRINKDCKITGSIEYSPSYTVSLTYEWFKPRALSYTNSSSVKLDIKVESSIDLYDNKDTVNITFARVPLSTPTLVSVWLDISLVVSLEGEVGLYTEITTSDTFSWKEGSSPITSKEKNVKVFTLDAAIAIKPELKFAFVVSLGFASDDASVDVADLAVSVGAEIKASASAEYQGCADISVKGFFKVGIRIGLLEGKKASVFGSWTPINLSWNILDGHFESSSMSFVDTCQFKHKYRVRFATGTQEQYPDYAATPNELLPRPEDPKRSGYTFGGWFSNTGSKLPWNFDTDIVTAPMTLYAGWLSGSNATATPTPSPTPNPDEPTPTPMPTISPDEEASLPFLVWENTGNNSIAITGYTGDPVYLVIPAYIDGLPVTYISYNAFQNCATLFSVTIPATVKCVYQNAFEKCENLRKVIFKGDLNILDSYVFRDCIRLQEVTLSERITDTLGSGIFQGCSALQEIAMPQEIPELYNVDNFFRDCTNLRTVFLPMSLTRIDSYMFENCTSLQRLYIPDSVERIWEGAFRGCTSLLNINLPESLISIGTEAFSGCTRLFEFTMHDAVISIGDKAFQNCTSLRNAELSKNLQTIGKYAFEYCSSLETLSLPASITSIGQSAYAYCTSLSSALIYSNLDLIDSYAFLNCSSLSEVIFTGSVKALGSGVFSRCTFLESITLPYGLTEIGNSAFNGCYSLQTISLPHSLTTIGTQAFMDCVALESVYLSHSLTSIGTAAFSNCQSLRNMVLPQSITTIGTQMFYNCSSLETVYIPYGVTSIHSNAFENCYNLKQVNLPGSLTSIGANAFKNCYALKVANCSGSFTTLTIGTSAFQNCSALENLPIPHGTTTIGDYAFSNCSRVKSVYMPDSVTSVGNNSFSGCASMSNLRFSSRLTHIGQWAFAGCSALTSLSLPASIETMGMLPFSNSDGIKTLIIPDGMTSIPAYAFAQMYGLTELYIPASVKEINTWAFTNCSSLEYLHITSNTTSIAEDAFNSIPNLRGVYVDSLDCYAADYFRARYSEIYTPIMLEPWASTQVTLVANGGAPDTVIMAETGARLPDVPKPSRQDYVFSGWYKDAGCTQPWRQLRDRVPSGSLTLYAAWDYAPADIAYTIRSGQAIVTAYTGYNAELQLPDTLAGYPVTEIAAEAIPDTLATLHVPASVTVISPEAFLWATSLNAITVDAANPIFHAADGVLYTREGTLVCYPAARSAGEYVPLDSTTTIGRYAFLNCVSLSSLTLPQTVTKLETYAISNCAVLESVHFAEDPAVISTGSLLGCSRNMAITGPLSAPVLSAWADAYALSYNQYMLHFLDGTELLGALFVRAGELLPASFQPERDTHTFAGWSADQGVTLWDFAADLMPEADLTLTAVWTEDFQYVTSDAGVTITAYTGGRSVVTVPETINNLSVIAISDGAFPGTVTTLRGNKGTPAAQYAAEHGLLFEPFVYTVTFVGNGGTPVPAQTLSATDAVIQPDISRSGYTLLNWYVDETLTCRWDFTAQTMPAHDLVLYAAWAQSDSTASEIPFTFDSFGQGLAITGYTGDASEAVIPAAINGIPVVHIAENAFADNNVLFTLTLPDTVLTIGENAFARSRISTLHAGAALTAIGSRAFEDCHELSTITLPNSLTSIGTFAFQNCTALITIALPDGITHLPEGVFAGCSYLAAVKLPSALEEISAQAFAACTDLPSISLGANVSLVDTAAFHGCTSLTAIDVAQGNMYLASVNGVLFSTDRTMLLLLPQGIKGEYTLPDDVISIAARAMQGSNIDALKVNASLRSISDNALSHSLMLSSILWPENAALTTIGFSAFDGCSSLRTVELPESVIEIGRSAFAHCRLVSAHVPTNAVVKEDAFQPVPSLTIYGTTGSDAQRYALEYGIRFVDAAADIPVTGVQLPAACTMVVGDSLTLTASLLPANTTETALEWLSLNPSVASVDALGRVLALNAGTAVIQVTAANGSVAQCTVTVVDKPSAPQDITLSTEELTLSQGEIATLTVQLWPENADAASVTWFTDDPSVAVCSGGVITAIGPGVAVLTATTPNQLSVSCTVTVLAAPERKLLTLPRSLLHIEDESFLGALFTHVVCPEGLLSIGSRAFADSCVTFITISASVEDIADDAFENCDVTFIVPAGSYAETYALEHVIPCMIQ